MKVMFNTVTGKEKTANNIKDFYDKFQLCVFCVFNMTGNYLTNNPPPVPYTNINELKRLWYSYQNEILAEKPVDEGKTSEKVYIYPNTDLQSQLKKFIDSVFKNTYSQMFSAEKNKIVNKIKLDNPLIISSIIENFNSVNKSKMKSNTNEAIRIINNNNALSSIGTLEFMDQIAKFNTVDIVYSEETGEPTRNTRITETYVKHNKEYKEIMPNGHFT